MELTRDGSTITMAKMGSILGLQQGQLIEK